MDLEIYALIRRLYFLDKLSRRAIARRLSVSRKTVQRALSMDVYQPPRRPKRGSLLDPFKPAIQKMLEDYPALNGVRIFEELGKQGYSGRITILRDYLREIRPSKKPVFLKLHFEPAEAFQVDWASLGTIQHEGEWHRLFAFLMVACFSRMLYVEFTLSSKTEEFLRCHQNAFHYFGGVFRYGIYDNLKSVVLSRVGDVIHFHPKFMEFSSYSLFEPRACRPKKPHEKGRIENAVRYLRSSFLSGRSFSSFTALCAEAVTWRDEVANVRVHKTTRKRPIDLFEEEKPLLRALPASPLDVRLTKTVKITSQARARFEANTYSVPPEYAGRALTLKASFREVTLYDGEKKVAAHRRTFARGKDVVDPVHERAIRARRRRADLSLLERDFCHISPEAAAYLKGLGKSALHPHVQMKKILGLIPLYGRVEVAQAIKRALEYSAFGFEYIHNIVLQERNRRKLPPESPLLLPESPEIDEGRFEERDLSDYETFLDERSDDEKEEGESD